MTGLMHIGYAEIIHILGIKKKKQLDACIAALHV